MIQIDKDHSKDKLEQRLSYPFVKMEVGDSFLLTEYKKAESARIAALLFVRRKSLECKFSFRKGSHGWRVIRVH
jgi:hypothetical protein